MERDAWEKVWERMWSFHAGQLSVQSFRVLWKPLAQPSAPLLRSRGGQGKTSA